MKSVAKLPRDVAGIL